MGQISTKAKRAIRAFEEAVRDYADLGTIPLYCDDPEEQRSADSMRLAIEHNYVKARAKLERLLENE